jgi:long-chain acyl-CoA synthetase
MTSGRAPSARQIKATTIPGIVRETADLYPDRTAVMHKDASGRYRQITYGQLVDLAGHVAGALKNQGIGPGDRVAICSYNGPDWVVADLAALSLGAIVVPIYPTLSPALIAHILRDSRTKLVFVEDARLFSIVEGVRSEVPGLGPIVVFEVDSMEGELRFLRFSVMKTQGPRPSCDKFEPAVSPESTATIVYTSGTTGDPKGVVLTHANIVTNALANIARFRVTQDDVYLSFLPLCHMLERTAGCYTTLFAGATMAYAGSPATIVEDVQVIRPTTMVVVPRIVEKIYEAVQRKVMEGSPIRRGMVINAVKVLNRRVNLEYRGLPVPVLLRLKSYFYDKFAAARLRAIAGGRLRFIISGGAPLDRKMAKTLWVLGFKILQGYGLTEMSPAVATTTLEDNCLGTVGKPYPGVEVKIGEADEILVRGPNLMRGYYNKPEATAEAIDRDGWFHTGDQGRFDQRGNLVITGRLKEIIVTSYGKNVAPVPVEARLAESPYIDQVMLCGDRRKYITALVVPSKPAITRFAGEAGIKSESYEALLKHARVRELVAAEIERATVDCAPYEKVKGFLLLSEGFTTENDLLTPTMKLRRARIEQRYAALVAALYAEAGTGR